MTMSYWNQMVSDRENAPFREGSPEWNHRAQQSSYGAQQKEYQAKQNKARDAKSDGGLLWMLNNDNMRAHWDAKYAQEPEKPKRSPGQSWALDTAPAPSVSPLRQGAQDFSTRIRQPLANVSAGTPLPMHGQSVKAGPSQQSSVLPWQSKPFMESTGPRGSSVHTGEPWRGGASIPSGIPPALERPGQQGPAAQGAVPSGGNFLDQGFDDFMQSLIGEWGGF